MPHFDYFPRPGEIDPYVLCKADERNQVTNHRQYEYHLAIQDV